MTRTITWEWGYYGRCFIDGKLSHEVEFEEVLPDTWHGRAWTPWDKGRTMLGTIKGPLKSIDDVVKHFEIESQRAVDHDKANLVELKRALREYPFGARPK